MRAKGWIWSVRDRGRKDGSPPMAGVGAGRGRKSSKEQAEMQAGAGNQERLVECGRGPDAV